MCRAAGTQAYANHQERWSPARGSLKIAAARGRLGHTQRETPEEGETPEEPVFAKEVYFFMLSLAKLSLNSFSII